MSTASLSDRPFSIGQPGGGSLSRLALRALAPALERLLGLTELNALYAREWIPRRDAGGFAARALEILDMAFDVERAPEAELPASGGVIVVANHPHGALDGLVLIAALQRVRPDVRVIGNHLLGRIPELGRLCFFLDVFAGPRARPANAAALREAIRWVERGGALVVFPAGEVSHLDAGDDRAVDPAWHPTVARLAERTRADVVPVFIDGANSRLFQMTGRIHPRLRTALLPRELLRQRGRRVRLVVGRRVPAGRLDELPDAATRSAYLRLRTYALAGGAAPAPPARSSRPPVAAAIPPDRLAGEIAALSSPRHLLGSGDHDVFCARAAELPHVLREIGRLRELTFRAAGEGTGQACDLDAFDRTYWHLFVWNRARREIAGAYRIGRTDEAPVARGARALYTSSLFRYDGRFLNALGPALELGRSFVRKEYQRDYGTLMLLWKGIGRLVARDPRYRMLFGPVSISADYSEASRELLVGVLSSARFQSALGSLVSPRHPVRALATAGWADRAHGALTAPDEINALLSELEEDGKGMPVLLRQYLKLNARLLAFSIDPDFGHVVDGLMVVDLLDVERGILQRYLGRDGAARFLAAHARHRREPERVEPVVVHAL